MNKYWNQKTNEITPYVAGEQPKDVKRLIKLNTNENPYGPSPKAAAVLKEINPDVLRLYPDTNSTLVREAVASVYSKYGITAENVFVGNGSDEVLAVCWQTFFENCRNTTKSVLSPEISYSFYPVYSEMYDVNLESIPLDSNYMIKIEDYIGRENCGIAIANPNAPTSVSMTSLDNIKRILEANKDVVVIIDEAYIAFAKNPISAVELVKEYKNLVVVQTMSKAYGLAGMRVGYAVADETLIEGMRRIRDSFNSYPVDRLAEQVAAEAILDQDYYNKTRNAVIATREKFVSSLSKMGFSVLPSSANFVFAKPEFIEASVLYQKLREKGIIVRYFNKQNISDYLRITIGTDADMNEFIKAIEEIKDVQNG
ncbi:MAG: histidinol-phosphate transaminase [Clostridia bacterium]|nr:histidinol-phosphate transaminase [Clostridia bacterium]